MLLWFRGLVRDGILVRQRQGGIFLHPRSGCRPAWRRTPPRWCPADDKQRPHCLFDLTRLATVRRPGRVLDGHRALHLLLYDDYDDYRVRGHVP